MKKLIFLFVIILAASILLNTAVYPAKPVRIDVLYMNHGPLQSTISKLRNIFAGYKNQIAVTWYDFESPEGGKFMDKKGIKGHIPLVIWINDSPVVKTAGKEISFTGFPSGSGPDFFQGKWTMDDLKTALDKATGRK